MDVHKELDPQHCIMCDFVALYIVSILVSFVYFFIG